jgi:hypothetical protein
VSSPRAPPSSSKYAFTATATTPSFLPRTPIRLGNSQSYDSANTDHAVVNVSSYGYPPTTPPIGYSRSLMAGDDDHNNLQSSSTVVRSTLLKGVQPHPPPPPPSDPSPYSSPAFDAIRRTDSSTIAMNPSTTHS